MEITSPTRLANSAASSRSMRLNASSPTDRKTSAIAPWRSSMTRSVSTNSYPRLVGKQPTDSGLTGAHEAGEHDVARVRSHGVTAKARHDATAPASLNHDLADDAPRDDECGIGGYPRQQHFSPRRRHRRRGRLTDRSPAPPVSLDRRTNDHLRTDPTGPRPVRPLRGLPRAPCEGGNAGSPRRVAEQVVRVGASGAARVGRTARAASTRSPFGIAAIECRARRERHGRSVRRSVHTVPSRAARHNVRVLRGRPLGSITGHARSRYSECPRFSSTTLARADERARGQRAGER